MTGNLPAGSIATGSAGLATDGRAFGRKFVRGSRRCKDSRGRQSGRVLPPSGLTFNPGIEYRILCPDHTQLH